MIPQIQSSSYLPANSLQLLPSHVTALLPAFNPHIFPTPSSPSPASNSSQLLAPIPSSHLPAPRAKTSSCQPQAPAPHHCLGKGYTYIIIHFHHFGNKITIDITKTITMTWQLFNPNSNNLTITITITITMTWQLLNLILII